MTREEAFADLKRTMSKETEDIVYRCNDCSKYNLCRYCHRRKETSQICHYFALEERKTGKWVHLPNVWGVVFCSECNYDLRINDTKYCPNCGAKMEVDE